MKINKMIDHTLLKADARLEQIEELCKQAADHNFKSVCVNPFYVKKCVELLKKTDVLVCTVIGFPLGQNTSEVKVAETEDALKNGAGEIDMVINIGALKDKQYDYVENEIRSIKNACGDKVLKVIIETCLLTEEEKVKACELSKKAGADFVKTSTGFSTGGATVEDVLLMRKTVGPEMGVKASGGIRDYKKAKEMIEAGANRLGVSAGLEIVRQADEEN